MSSVRFTNDSLSSTTFPTQTAAYHWGGWSRVRTAGYGQASDTALFAFGRANGPINGFIFVIDDVPGTEITAGLYTNDFTNPTDSDFQVIITGSNTDWFAWILQYSGSGTAYTLRWRFENQTTWNSITLDVLAVLTSMQSIWIGDDQFGEPANDVNHKGIWCAAGTLSDAAALTASQNARQGITPVATPLHWLDLDSATNVNVNGGSAGDWTIGGSPATDASEPIESAGGGTSSGARRTAVQNIEERARQYSIRSGISAAPEPPVGRVWTQTRRQEFAPERHYASRLLVGSANDPGVVEAFILSPGYFPDEVDQSPRRPRLLRLVSSAKALTASPVEASSASAILDLQSLLASSPGEASATTATLMLDNSLASSLAEASAATATLALDNALSSAASEASVASASIQLDNSLSGVPAETSSTTASIQLDTAVSSSPSEASSASSSIDLQALLMAAPAEVSSISASLQLENSLAASPAEASTATAEMFLENISGLVASPAEVSSAAATLDLQALLTDAADEASTATGALLIDALITVSDQEASAASSGLTLDALPTSSPVEASSTAASLNLDALVLSAPAEASSATAELDLANAQGGSADEVSAASAVLNLQALLASTSVESSATSAAILLDNVASPSTFAETSVAQATLVPDQAAPATLVIEASSTSAELSLEQLIPAEGTTITPFPSNAPARATITKIS